MGRKRSKGLAGRLDLKSAKGKRSRGGLAALAAGGMLSPKRRQGKGERGWAMGGMWKEIGKKKNRTSKRGWAMVEWADFGKSKGRKDLASHMGLDKRSIRRDNRSSIGAKAAQALRDRMSRTERLQVAEAMREAYEQDELVSRARRDAQLVNPQRPSVIRRLITVVQNRIAAFRME